MCGRSGTATVTRPSPGRARLPSTTASSAGRRPASANQGTRPSASQPVFSAISVMPSAKREGSPRNLLTMKPRISAASLSPTTARVPTIWAMTPPRSMSPTSTTGTPAACANPMLAMSLRRRLTSAALPAPSTSTRSASALIRAKLSSTASSRRGFQAWYSRALAEPATLPCTTICEPISLWGLRSTGFMCTEVGAKLARAWRAWARPISPPSAVTAALLDMFCGLNGRTTRPRRAKARQRPATISDLPTSEPVPWNIRQRASMVRTRCPSAPSRRRRSGASPASSRSPGRPPRSAPAWRCGR
jgi:hypothetical protein